MRSCDSPRGKGKNLELISTRSKGVKDWTEDMGGKGQIEGARVREREREREWF